MADNTNKVEEQRVYTTYFKSDNHLSEEKRTKAVTRNHVNLQQIDMDYLGMSIAGGDWDKTTSDKFVKDTNKNVR